MTDNVHSWQQWLVLVYGTSIIPAAGTAHSKCSYGFRQDIQSGQCVYEQTRPHVPLNDLRFSGQLRRNCWERPPAFICSLQQRHASTDSWRYYIFADVLNGIFPRSWAWGQRVICTYRRLTGMTKNDVLLREQYGDQLLFFVSNVVFSCISCIIIASSFQSVCALAGGKVYDRCQRNSQSTGRRRCLHNP